MRRFKKKQRVRVKANGDDSEQYGVVYIGTTPGHGNFIVVRLDESYRLSSEDEGLRILESDQVELTDTK